MFGYIRTYKAELKLKDVKRYSAYYCALCTQIKNDYGQIYRLFLTYDATYLAIVLNELFADTKEQSAQCVNCMNKRKISVWFFLILCSKS